MNSVVLNDAGLSLHVEVLGEGPLIVCVHGWPELSHSWRHQLAYFSTRGYRIAAVDVRGYGNSSAPWGVEAYSMRNLCRDVATVVTALLEASNHPSQSSSQPKAILFGHDWGAPIVWNTAVLFPELIGAVAGLSVPFVPIRSRSFLEIAAEVYRDRFFYQLFFRKKGEPRTTLRRTSAPPCARSTMHSRAKACVTRPFIKQCVTRARMTLC